MATQEGLCGSNVQKTWLEATLQTTLKTTAHFGPNFSSTQIAIGQGYFSIMAKVICDWQGADSQKLPASFVVKIPSLVALEKMNGPSFEDIREGTARLLKKVQQ